MRDVIDRQGALGSIWLCQSLLGSSSH
jgi:hypothetical protein